jgi:biotin synthase
MITEILNKQTLLKDDLIKLLSASDDNNDIIRQKAYSIMQQFCGDEVYLRGLIEFSNYCIYDCYYCGIRKSNHNIERYTLDRDEIIDSAKWCSDNGYGSLVLQSGERSDPKFIDYVCDLVQSIKKDTINEKMPDGLGITLCVGEQSLETYQRFRLAGAHRYLLRIETSNRELYYQIHPEEQSFERRIEALRNLKSAGFQVGTGVMIGLPNQTIEHLADDILFFSEMDVDMIGMGPYIVHNQTPMSHLEELYKGLKKDIYKLALRMIAVTRIFLKDVNIASTTALQAMYPMGREAGLMNGANIIMPLLTPTQVREKYTLYDGKPCIDEFSSDCYECIQRRIESTGRTVGKDNWGDSKHFSNKYK